MPRNLALCFDGTWNQMLARPLPGHDTNTNVVKIYDSIPQSATQLAWYDQGVGTHGWDKIIGGISGVGIDCNIMAGYAWLADNYQDGDDIYVFGFSRGAFTARSLAGFIFKCGLLPTGNRIEVSLAFEKYRKNSILGAIEDWFFSSKAHIVPIKFIGVWDTVGALGIPLSEFKAFDSALDGFHDVTLHENVLNAYHAVAVDEHRLAFDITLWDPPSTTLAAIEQRWFVGAHANVGGGITDLDQEQWSNLTLRWMQEKAQGCGLALKLIDPPTMDWMQPIDDSYGDFLDGLYAKEFSPNYRAIGATKFGNEVIDDSVRQRMTANSDYRPQNAGLTE